MGFFGKILDKLGMGGRDAAAGTTAATSTPAQAAPTAPRPATTGAPAGAPPSPGAAPKAPGTGEAAPRTPQGIPVVDVVAQLETRAKSSSQPLNWRTSIVDLLKLLDIDSSLEARKSLAQELGAPGDVMGDSARMNTWLHKTVLERIAANGGNVPKELLD